MQLIPATTGFDQQRNQHIHFTTAFKNYYRCNEIPLVLKKALHLKRTGTSRSQMINIGFHVESVSGDSSAFRACSPEISLHENDIGNASKLLAIEARDAGSKFCPRMTIERYYHV